MNPEPKLTRIQPLKLYSLKVYYEIYSQNSTNFHPNQACDYSYLLKLGLHHSKAQKLIFLSPIIAKFNASLKRFMSRIPKTCLVSFLYFEEEENCDFWMLFEQILPQKFFLFASLIRSLKRLTCLEFFFHASISHKLFVMIIKSIQTLKFLNKLKLRLDFWTDPAYIDDQLLSQIGKTCSKLQKLTFLDLSISRHDFTIGGFSNFYKDLERLRDLKVLKLKFYRYLAFLRDNRNMTGNDKYANEVLNNLGNSLRKLKQLESLKICQIPISGTALERVCVCGLPGNLRSLSLCLNNSWMDDRGIEALIDQFGNLKYLEELNLNLRFPCPISSHMISKILSCKSLQRLTIFKFEASLNYNMQVSQLKEFCDNMKNMKRIKSLDMRFSYLRFTEVEYKQFFEVLGELEALEMLQLKLDHTEVNYNSLLVLGCSLGKMLKLRKLLLNLSNSHVKAIPSNFFYQEFINLEDLELDLRNLSLSKSTLLELIASITKNKVLNRFLINVGKREFKHHLQDFLDNRTRKRIGAFQVV